MRNKTKSLSIWMKKAKGNFSGAAKRITQQTVKSLRRLVQRRVKVYSKFRERLHKLLRFIKHDILLIENEPKDESIQEYKFIKIVENWKTQLPFATFFVLTFIGLIAEYIGISDTLKQLARHWISITRDAWGRLFSFIHFPIEISVYEYDILTLASMCLGSFILPVLISKIRINSLQKYKQQSLWSYNRRIKEFKGAKRIIGISMPFIVAALFFVLIALANINEKLNTKEGQYQLRVELGLVLIVLIFITLYSLIKSVITRKWGAILNLPMYYITHVLIYTWYAAFISSNVYQRDSHLEKQFSFLIVGTGTILFFVAFIRNWAFFALCSLYFGAVMLFDSILLNS